MYSKKWLLPILAAGGSLMAQSMGDLNGLASTAARFLSHGLAGTQGRPTLALCKMKGDNGPNPALLMTRGIDVVHWTFLYRAEPTPATGADSPAAGANTSDEDAIVLPKNSVTVQSKRGIFGDFQYSPAKVLDAKPVEYAWIAISLDDAIRQLNYNGYARGFSTVTLVRPADNKYPDEYVYVFDCPWERTRVALSSQTGALTWTERY